MAADVETNGKKKLLPKAGFDRSTSGFQRGQYLRLPTHANLHKMGPSAVTSYMNLAFAAAATAPPAGALADACARWHAHAASSNVRLAA